MKNTMIVLLGATLLFPVAAFAAPVGQPVLHQRPPFNVIKARVLHRLGVVQQRLPARMACVRASTDLGALRSCFPHMRKVK